MINLEERNTISLCYDGQNHHINKLIIDLNNNNIAANERILTSVTEMPVPLWSTTMQAAGKALGICKGFEVGGWAANDG